MKSCEDIDNAKFEAILACGKIEGGQMGSTKTDAEIVKLRNLMRGQGTHREARHSIAKEIGRAQV